MLTSISPLTGPQQLRIDMTHPSPDTVLATLVGEVDLATAPVLRERLLDVLRRRPPTAVTVDLSGVTFLDCAGIGALIAVRNVAVAGGGQLWVTDPRPIVHQILDLTGLLGILTAPADRTQRTVLTPEGPPEVGIRRNPVPRRPPERLAAA